MVEANNVSLELGLDEVLVEHVMVVLLMSGYATPPALTLSPPQGTTRVAVPIESEIGCGGWPRWGMTRRGARRH
jgi:hypothetical protein